MITESPLASSNSSRLQIAAPSITKSQTDVETKISYNNPFKRYKTFKDENFVSKYETLVNDFIMILN